MASYQLLNVEGNNAPIKCYKEITFIDFNYDVKMVEKTEFESDKKVLMYHYKTIRVRGGNPTRDELIRALIHTEYSLDDEIALMNNRDSKPQEYDAYIIRRNELKAIAKDLYEEFLKTN